MLKKLTLTLFAATALFPALRAENVEVDGIKYSTDTYNLTASVIRYDSSNNGEFYKGDITIPETITVNGYTFTITSVGDYAFRDCNDLTGISLPQTVTTLGTFAFYQCSKLRSVSDLTGLMSIRDYAFGKCSSLQAIGDMPLLTTLFSGAFEGCSSLQSIGDMPLLTSLADYAFQGCSSLQSIGDMPALKSIGTRAFYGCRSLQNVGNISAVTTIQSYAFYLCSSSLVLTLNQVTSIGEGALATSGATYIFEGQIPPTFNSACGLNSSNKVIVPDEAEEAYMTALSRFGTELWTQTEYNQIPETSDETKHDYVITTSAIESTSALKKELIKSNGVDVNPLVETLKVIGTINTKDFTTIKSLTNLKSLDLSEATIEGNTIPAEGLKNLAKLESIALPESLTSIGNNAFNGCAALQRLGDLPALTSIGDFAFSRCSSLQSIGNMNALTNIGQYAFSDNNSYYYAQYCSALQTVGEMPELSTIGTHAFYGCSALQTIGEMPKLSTIGTYAFYGCSALQTIGEMPALTSIGGYAFAGCGISEFNLPESITSVTTNAFSESALVHFAGATPPTFAGTSFATHFLYV